MTKDTDSIIADIESHLDTGIAFYIDRLIYGHTHLDLAIPIEVYARTGEDGPVIWCEDMPLHGCGRTVQEAYREFSICVISAVEVFCAEDSPAPIFGRKLTCHVEGIRC